MNRYFRIPANKYGVAPAAKRQWRNRTWDSQAEMLRAQYLVELQRLGAIQAIVFQPMFMLGEDVLYRADFLWLAEDGVIHTEDVKGVYTKDFKRIIRLWRRYGSMPLEIVKRRGKGWQGVEVIEPAGAGA